MTNAIKAKSKRFGYWYGDFAASSASSDVFGVKGYSKRHCLFYNCTAKWKIMHIVNIIIMLTLSEKSPCDIKLLRPIL